MVWKPDKKACQLETQSNANQVIQTLHKKKLRLDVSSFFDNSFVTQVNRTNLAARHCERYLESDF